MISSQKILYGSLIVAAGSAFGISQALAGSPFSVPPGYFEQNGPVTNSYGVAGAPPNPFSTFLDGVRCHYEYRPAANGGRVQVKICD
jgi:hypothetical protein